ncbi:hypothetical protein [Spiroplasma endosymbiont of Villa modesta]|uniref:hypothetical protein n=1 Tax=Spiroplasma endosymbiont of Villa modesta TaxID=3066293 RepID=UPI00313ABCCD
MKPLIGAKNKSMIPNGPPSCQGLSVLTGFDSSSNHLPVVPGIQEIIIIRAIIKNKTVIAVGILNGNKRNFFFLVIPIYD